MQFPHELFKAAGLNSTDVAALCNVSRVTGWRWMQGMSRHGEPGVGVNTLLEDRVQDLATQVQGAVDAGTLPAPEMSDMAVSERAEFLQLVLQNVTATK